MLAKLLVMPLIVGIDSLIFDCCLLSAEEVISYSPAAHHPL